MIISFHETTKRYFYNSTTALGFFRCLILRMRIVALMIEKITLKSPTPNFLKPENLPVNVGNVSAFCGSSSLIFFKILSASSLSIFFRSREADFLKAILWFKFFPHVLYSNNRISDIMQPVVSNLQISDFRQIGFQCFLDMKRFWPFCFFRYFR